VTITLRQKKIKVKSKVLPVHSPKAYSKIRGITPLILNAGTGWWCGQLQALAALLTRKTE
jgi:hypothetical protein